MFVCDWLWSCLFVCDFGVVGLVLGFGLVVSVGLAWCRFMHGVRFFGGWVIATLLRETWLGLACVCVCWARFGVRFGLVIATTSLS